MRGRSLASASTTTRTASACRRSRGLLPPCDANELAGIFRSVRASVVIRVNGLEREPRTREQVLDFEAEEIAHEEAVHETLRAAVRVRDVVDQLGVDHLVGEVARGQPVAAH